MPEKLLYRYEVGEVLRYQLLLNMLVAEPGVPEQAGQIELELDHSVLEENVDGSWTVEIRTRVVSADATVEGDVARFFPERVVVMRMDARGTPLDASGNPPAVRLAAFPDEPLSEGTQWTVTDATGPVPLEITYIVQSFEPSEDGPVANLVSTARGDDPQEGSVTTVDSTMEFAVAGGCLLGSTSVIETQWPNGRKLSMVLENHLVERGITQAHFSEEG